MFTWAWVRTAFGSFHCLLVGEFEGIAEFLEAADRRSLAGSSPALRDLVNSLSPS